MRRTERNVTITLTVGASVILALSAAAGAGLLDGLLRGARGGAQAATVLTSGRQVMDLKGYAGSEAHFKILVPAGQARLSVQTLGGTGDADLYLQYATAPTRAAFARRSIGRASTESVTVDNPQAGWWHVMIHGAANYSGVRLTATVTPPATPRTPTLPDPADVPNVPRGVLRLVPGKGLAGLSGNEGSKRYFQVIVPARATSVTISTGGGMGDCDLFLTRGGVPDVKRYEHVSNGSGTTEKITVKNPKPGTWYVLLLGYKNFKDVSLGLSVKGGVGPVARRSPLEITAPEAGSVLRAGATYNLRWRALEQRGRVRVLESYDGGLSWSDIRPASVTDIRKGELRWTVPFSVRGKGGDSLHLRVVGLDDKQLLVDAGPFKVVRRGPVAIGGQPRLPAGVPRGVSREDYRLGRYEDTYEPDSQNKPTPIELGAPQRHTIFERGDKDWIVFRPAVPGKYLVTVDGVLVKTDFVIYTGRAGDGKLTDILKAGVKADGWSAEVEIDRSIAFLLFRATADKPDQTGPYRVTVQRVSPAGGKGRPGKGRLPLKPRPAIDPEALRLGRYVDEHEPDGQTKPAAIALGAAQRQTIYPKGDKDWIKFTPPSTGKYRVTVSDVTTKTNFVIYTGRAGDGKLTDIYKAGVKAAGWSADVDVDETIGFLLFRATADDRDDVGGYTVTVKKITFSPPQRVGPRKGGKGKKE